MAICGLAPSKACVRLPRKHRLPRWETLRVQPEKDTARTGHVTKSASADYETGSFVWHEVFFSPCSPAEHIHNNSKPKLIPPVFISGPAWPVVCWAMGEESAA
jgi:hypothetical protein